MSAQRLVCCKNCGHTFECKRCGGTYVMEPDGRMVCPRCGCELFLLSNVEVVTREMPA